MPFRHFFRKEYFWIVIGIASSLLLAKSVFGALLANFGMLEFEHALMQEKDHRAPSIYPLRATRPGHADFRGAKAWLQFANRIQASAAMGWKLTRLGLASGEQTLAMAGVQQMRERISRDPLAYEDALLTLSLNKQYQAIVDLYERDTPQLRTAVLSDTVALAYLELAKSFLDTHAETTARPILDKVIRLRPSDLYANVRLYQIAREANDAVAGSTYSQTLTHFPGSSLHPTDERLIGYVIQAIPLLQAEGIWAQDIADRVLATLIWLYPEYPDLESLVSEQTHQNPFDSQARFNLAELYQRRGNSSQAEANYRHVLELDPGYADAYWRLGLLCEQRSDQCAVHQVLEWYMKYLIRRPDDLSVIRRVRSLCEKVGTTQPDATSCERISRIVSAPTAAEASAVAALDRLLHDRLDIQSAIAALSETSAADFDLGPNLLANPEFASAGQGNLPGWRLSDEIGQGATYRSGVFVGGQDTLDAWTGDAALRVIGPWRNPGVGSETPAWYGAWGWDESQQHVLTLPNKPAEGYVISILYRTEGKSDTVSLHLNQNTLLKLPSTDGAWRHFLATYCSLSPDSASLAPFIYLSVPGDQVWIDAVSIYHMVSRSPVEKHCTTTQFTL